MSFEGSVELHVTAAKALLIVGSHMPEVWCYCFLIAYFVVFFSDNNLLKSWQFF
jgi:hypothetical protein